MLIAFTGKLGSGKDTAGERFAKIVGGEGVRLSFARPLKQSAANLLDIPVEDWETYKNDPDALITLSVGYGPSGLVDHHGIAFEEPTVVKQFTAREFLQRYGTEAHRDVFGDNFWVDQAMAQYHPTPGVYYYVTDCRFLNEAQAVKDRGGIIVRLIGANEDTGTHASEVSLPDEFITFFIDNSIRDDDFGNLDRALTILAQHVGLMPVTA